MADQNAPESTPTPSNKATVRITLPPKPAIASEGLAKKETVRVGGLKKQTIRINPSAPSVPSDVAGIPPMAPPPVGKLPPPPKPPGPLGFKPPAPPSLGAPGARPVPPAMAMSKPVVPPSPPSAPTAPSAPVMPAAAAPAAPAAAPAIQKPLTPKKETSRIQLPPTAAKSMPKATVKLSQTVPISQAPVASIKTATVPETESDAETDKLLLPLSILAVVLGLIAVFFSYTAFNV